MLSAEGCLLTGAWRPGFWGGIVGLALRCRSSSCSSSWRLDSGSWRPRRRSACWPAGSCCAAASSRSASPRLRRSTGSRAACRPPCPMVGSRPRPGGRSERQGHPRRPAAVRRLRALRGGLLARPHRGRGAGARAHRGLARRGRLSARRSPATTARRRRARARVPTKACRQDVGGGRVVIDERLCIGCRACNVACPVRARALRRRRAGQRQVRLLRRRAGVRQGLRARRHPLRVRRRELRCTRRRGRPSEVVARLECAGLAAREVRRAAADE